MSRNQNSIIIKNEWIKKITQLEESINGMSNNN